MDVKGVFGANLKHYRKERNLSQEQLSEKVNISAKHLSEIERGIVFASAGLIGKFAESLDIPIVAFFLTDDNIYYDKVMLDKIKNEIIQNVEQTMNNIKKGVFSKS